MSNHRPIWTDSGPDICVVDDETWPCAFMQDAARRETLFPPPPPVSQEAYEERLNDWPASPEPTPGLRGEDVHREWRDGMLAQGRDVAPERMRWETLSEADRLLDDRIAERLAALAASPAPEPRRCEHGAIREPCVPCSEAAPEPTGLDVEAYFEKHGHEPYCPADFIVPKGPCACRAARLTDSGATDGE